MTFPEASGTFPRGNGVHVQARVIRAGSRRQSVVELQVRVDNRTAPLSARIWDRSRGFSSRFCARAVIVLASSLLAVSSIGAQRCHERAPSAGATHEASAALAQQPHHATASPAMREMRQHQEPAAPAWHEASITTRACCCDDDGLGSSCPSSCPVTGTCSGQGPVAALYRGERDSLQVPVSPPALSAATARPDSWCGSLDTPPPRS